MKLYHFFLAFPHLHGKIIFWKGLLRIFISLITFFFCVLFICLLFFVTVCLETTNEMKNWNYEELSLKFWGCGKWTKDLKSLPQIQKVYSSPYSTTILHSKIKYSWKMWNKTEQTIFMWSWKISREINKGSRKNVYNFLQVEK